MNRRDVVRLLGHLFLWGSAVFGMTLTGVSSAAARIRKRIVPEKTDPDRLRNSNPRYLDTRNLQVMPLHTLENVGDDEAPFDATTWQLNVDGAVSNPMTFTHAQIKSMPYEERNVLLICSGIFAFHGRWKGITLDQIIKTVHPKIASKACIVYGHSRSGVRKERFKLDALAQDEFLLAYGVNGKELGSRHGFPLRVVAPGRWGEQWVKYVIRIEFV